MSTSRRLIALVFFPSLLAAVSSFAAVEVRPSEELSAPVLACTPAKLSCTVKLGDAPKLTFTVRNAGGRKLAWSVSAAPEWVRVEPRGGELSFGKSQDVSVTVSPAGTLEREAHGEIVIAAPGAAGSPKQVAITLKVILPEPVGPPPGPSRGRFVARTGIVIPGSGKDKDFDPGAFFGFLYHFEHSASARLSFEAGIDAAAMDASDGSEVTRVFAASFNVLFMGRDAGGSRGYALSGLGILADSVAGDTYKMGALDLGGGFEFGDGRWDIRLTHRVLLGSENVKGLTHLAVGVSF